MKVALIGEGKNDIGIDSHKEKNPWNEGAVQPLLRKFLDQPEFIILKNKRLESKFKIPSAKIPKFGPRAAKLRQFLGDFRDFKGTVSLIIFYQDLDKRRSGPATKTEAKGSFREAMSDIEVAEDWISKNFAITLIPMIPMRMLENWLLADEKAYEKAFGTKPTKPKLPTEPEFIWGDEETRTSEHPKNYIQRLLEQYQEDATTENFILIAEAAEVATMERTCPNSFALFAQRMKNFAAQRR